MIAPPVAHHIVTAIPFFVPALVLPAGLAVIAFRDRRRVSKGPGPLETPAERRPS